MPDILIFEHFNAIAGVYWAMSNTVADINDITGLVAFTLNFILILRLSLFLVMISIATKFWIDDDNVIVLFDPLSLEYNTVSRYTAKFVRADFAVVPPVPPFDNPKVAVLVIPDVPLPKRICPLDKLVCPVPPFDTDNLFVVLTPDVPLPIKMSPLDRLVRPVPPFATDTGKYAFAWLIL